MPGPATILLLLGVACCLVALPPWRYQLTALAAGVGCLGAARLVGT